MLLFPRHFDMFEMKRPQHMSGIFDDDYDSFFSDARYHYGNRQQERVPVPVHHQPVGQQQQQSQYPHQMPVPQPTGNPNYGAQPKEPSRPQYQPTVSSFTQIPVRHIPVGEESEVDCGHEKMIPVDVEHVAVAPRSTEGGNMETMQEPSASVNPGTRKQTSLIVSDDHVTPIPLTYGREPAFHETIPGDINKLYSYVPPFHGAIKQDISKPVQQNHPKRHDNDTGDESPYATMDDISTPKLITLHQTEVEPGVTECGNSTVVLPPGDSSYGEMQSEECTSSKALENDVRSVDDDNNNQIGYNTESPAIADMASAAKTLTSTKSARKIPIASVGDARKTQRPPLKRYTSKTKDIAEDRQARQQRSRPEAQNHAADVRGPASTSNKASMPQPDIKTSQTNYTTSKPAAPAPKPQWVDPRITEAIKAIEAATAKAESLGSQVDALEVVTKDRVYLGIEEQLTKLLLKLDGVDSMGDENVRTKRKACIVKVQQTLDALELKLLAS